jgi:tRNA modification GTPase
MTAATPQTIFALSSGRPPAAIAVVRVSGPRARFSLEKLIGRVPAPRRAALATIRDPAGGETIDEALVLWFPGPASETGEDVVEFQVHGGRAVIAGVLAALARLDGFRPAEAGEFTRRAFANGHIDLTGVEALADLIGAETDAQRRQAVHQLKGLLGARAETWRQRAIEALALVEAGLDFSDESDVPDDTIAPALKIAAELSAEIAEVLADSQRGERLREGLTIAIAGPPNAGKSSLFNALARRDAAIVSPYPGTTRDVLEIHMDLDGYPVTILDTAGLRPSDDPVEREGISRAQARAGLADLVLWVTDVATENARGPAPGETKTGQRVWLVFNKSDLLPPAAEHSYESAAGRFLISARTGSGLAELISALTKFADQAFGGGEPAVVTRARHRQTLERVRKELNHAMEIDSSQADLIAEQFRLAACALGALLGRVDVEDVLDTIFRDFCIGK